MTDNADARERTTADADEDAMMVEVRIAAVEAASRVVRTTAREVIDFAEILATYIRTGAAR
jgi:hypothetical protein